MNVEFRRVLLLVFVLLLVGWFIASIYLTGLINPFWAAALWAVYHFGYVLPKFSKSYALLAEEDIGISAYIPIYNEITVFPPVLSKILLWCSIVISLLALLALLPSIGVVFVTSLVSSLFGEQAAMDYIFYLWLVVALLILGTNVVKGIAYGGINRAINREINNLFRSGKTEWLAKFSYFTVFFPFLRTISLIFITDRCKKLEFYANRPSEDFVEVGGVN